MKNAGGLKLSVLAQPSFSVHQENEGGIIRL